MADRSERYLIAPTKPAQSDQLLGDVAMHIEQTPGATIVKTRPGRLVVEMAQETVEEIRSKFPSGLIIEPDSPLKY